MDSITRNFVCLAGLMLLTTIAIYQIPVQIKAISLDFEYNQYKLKTIAKVEGCHQFTIAAYQSPIMARHCKFDNLLTNGASINSYDVPIFVKTGEFTQFPKPKVGAAQIRVFRVLNGVNQIVTKAININNVTDCIANYSLINPIDYMEQGDSGAPIIQKGIVIGAQSGIDINQPLQNRFIGPLQSQSGNLTYRHCV